MAFAKELNLVRFLKIRTMGWGNNKMKLIGDSQLASLFSLMTIVMYKDFYLLGVSFISYIVIFQKD